MSGRSAACALPIPNTLANNIHTRIDKLRSACADFIRSLYFADAIPRVTLISPCAGQAGARVFTTVRFFYSRDDDAFFRQQAGQAAKLPSALRRHRSAPRGARRAAASTWHEGAVTSWLQTGDEAAERDVPQIEAGPAARGAAGRGVADRYSRAAHRNDVSMRRV